MAFLAAIPAMLGAGGAAAGGAAAGAGALGAGAAGAGALGAGAAGAAGAGALGAGLGTTAGLAGLASTTPVMGAAVGAGAGAGAAGAGAGLLGMGTGELFSTTAPFLSSLGSLTGDKSLTSLGAVAKSGGNLMSTLGDVPLGDTLKSMSSLGGDIGKMFGGGGGEYGNQPQPQPQPQTQSQSSSSPSQLPPQALINIASPTTRMLSSGSNTGYAPTANKISQLMFRR